MATLHGRATFPGLKNGILSCEYTNSQGGEPGCALLTVPPQDDWPAKGGDLVMTDGRVTIRLRDCKVSQVKALPYNGGLTAWQVCLLDRRWRWAGGYIGGHYNVRDGVGAIIPETERTPQQMAALCFQAMGERTFNVGQLPNDARPETHWDAAEPLRALEDLIEQLGCRVTLNLASNQAVVVRLGVGAQLPRGERLELQETVQAPERPDSIVFLGGPTLYQTMFFLEPVGLDTDETIRPIRELSYRPRRFHVGGLLDGQEIIPEEPETGWENSAPPHFPEVTDEAANLLARLSVFKWYRIKMVDPKTIRVLRAPDANPNLLVVASEMAGAGFPSVPGDWTRQNLRGTFKVRDLAEVLPIQDTQILADPNPAIPGRPDVPGLVVNMNYSARVFGYWLKPTLDGSMVQPPGDEWKHGFKIEKELGIVDFSPKYVTMRARVRGETKIRPALMFLQTSHHVLDSATREPRRYSAILNLPGPRNGTLPRVIRDEQSTLMVAVDDEESILIHNQDELDEEAAYHLQAEAARYEVRTPQEAVYGGLQPIQVDGAIRQVTYSIGPPTTTRASRQSEHSLYVEPYTSRRQRIQARHMLSPEFLRNTRQQLQDIRQQMGRVLGPGLRA